MIDEKQMIKDLRDFDAEFELWLEGTYERVKNVSCDEWEHGYKSAIVEAREKYLEFKKRIQYDDELQAPELAPEEWVMLECIAEDWKHDSFVYNDTRKAIFEALFNRGFIVKKVWQWHATDQGRAALAKYQDTQHDE